MKRILYSNEFGTVWEPLTLHGGHCCYPPPPPTFVSGTVHGHWKWSVLRLVGFGLDCNRVWLLADHFFSGKLTCMEYEWLEQLRRSLCSTESDSEHSSHEWNSISLIYTGMAWIMNLGVTCMILNCAWSWALTGDCKHMNHAAVVGKCRVCAWTWCYVYDATLHN